MSLGLVAYGSSDESDGSDNEDPPQTVKSQVPTESTSPAESPNPQGIGSGNGAYSASQALEPHFSDEEDDYIGNFTGSLNLPPPRSSGLSLPAPKGEGTVQASGNTEEEGQSGNTLLAGLPAPKTSGASGSSEGEADLEDIVKPKPIELEIAKQEKPPPKKRQTVKISIPSLDQFEDEEEEPSKKKPKFTATGKSGLFALLPEPKNTNIKAGGRALIPYSLTQKQRQPPKPAVKPAVKPAPVSKHVIPTQNAFPKLPGVPTDDYSDDEDTEDGNFFSLDPNSSAVSSAPVVSAPTVSSQPNPSSETAAKRSSSGSHDSSDQDASTAMTIGAEDAPLKFENPMDAPLDFKNSSMTAYTSHSAGPAEGYQDYNQQYGYNQPYDEAAPPELQPESDLALPDDQLLRLQGKHKRGKEEITFVNVNVDDKLAGTSIELTKGITEEQEAVSNSRKKKDQPSSQQKRKHQITYLAHKAKEREFELKNTWAENRLTKKQTQAKYGF